MDNYSIKDEIIISLAEEVIKTLNNGKKLVVFCHDANYYSSPWRRHISLWIIHDGNEAYNLSYLVEAMGVAKRMPSRNAQFSVCYIGQFIQVFIKQLNKYFNTDFDTEADEKYYRFLV